MGTARAREAEGGRESAHEDTRQGRSSEHKHLLLVRRPVWPSSAESESVVWIFDGRGVSLRAVQPHRTRHTAEHDHQCGGEVACEDRGTTSESKREIQREKSCIVTRIPLEPLCCVLCCPSDQAPPTCPMPPTGREYAPAPAHRPRSTHRARSTTHHRTRTNSDIQAQTRDERQKTNPGRIAPASPPCICACVLVPAKSVPAPPVSCTPHQCCCQGRREHGADHAPHDESSTNAQQRQKRPERGRRRRKPTRRGAEAEAQHDEASRRRGRGTSRWTSNGEALCKSDRMRSVIERSRKDSNH